MSYGVLQVGGPLEVSPINEGLHAFTPNVPACVEDALDVHHVHHPARRVSAVGAVAGALMLLTGCGAAMPGSSAPGEAGGDMGTVSCPGPDRTFPASFGKFTLVTHGISFPLRYDGTTGVNGNGFPEGYTYADGENGVKQILRGDARGDTVQLFTFVADDRTNTARIHCLPS